MKSDFLIAVTQLAAERGIPKEMVVDAVEAALVSAYKKDTVMSGYDISVSLNPGNGEIKVYSLKEVVKTPTDLKKELGVKEARKHVKKASLGDIVEIETDFPLAGRIAAQTAKQVVIQRLRDAEREMIFNEFSSKVGDVISGRIDRIEPDRVMVNLGKYEAVLPAEEQIPTERYRVGQTLKLYLVEVRNGEKEPEVILSRTHKTLLKRLFELEVPEIFNGTVEIKAVAREPGSRSKVAVFASQEGIDPVGSCVGLRGFRIQNIVNELQGEKVDVIPWSKDISVFMSNALSPSQVLRTELNEKENKATVIVSDQLLSLAIGREGQNVRLAAKLTGWKIDVKGGTEWEAEHGTSPTAQAVTKTEEVTPKVETASPAVTSEVKPVTDQATETKETPKPEDTGTEGDSSAETPEPVKEESSAPSLSEVGDEIWNLPKIESAGKKPDESIRFAEDIMPKRPKGKGGSEGSTSQARQSGRTAKGTKTKRSRQEDLE